MLKYQNQMLTQSEYSEHSFEKCVEKTFDELYEELTEFVQQITSDNNQRALSFIKGAPGSFKLPSLPLMERLEKLSGDYDI